MEALKNKTGIMQ